MPNLRTPLFDWHAAHGARMVPFAGWDMPVQYAGMLAVQGPKAIELAAGLFDVDVALLKYYFAAPTLYCRNACVVSRTGYTGEDGFEVIVPAELAVTLGDELVSRGAVPCGLGARDT